MTFLQLNPGEYALNEALTGILKDAIAFEFGKTYLLLGENGVGKTSFLKNLLIPKIDKAATNQFLFYHLEQDIALQQYVIRAFYKGLKNADQDFSTLEKSLIHLKQAYLDFLHYKNKNIVYALDEADQYLNLNQFLGNLPPDRSTLILITHHLQAIHTLQNPMTLRFKKINEHSTEISFQPYEASH